MDLPHFSILISDKQYRKLNRNIWSEKPVEAELQIEDKTFDVDLLYRGNHVREFSKKSYHCIFPEITAGIKEIHYNAEFMDKSLMRNKLSLDFFSSIGVLSPTAKHVLLSINEENQGVYLQLESVDRNFLKRRKLPSGPIYYAENDDANFSLHSPIDEDIKDSFDSGYSRKEGSSRDDKTLQELIYKINTLKKTEFERAILDYINIDKYLRWLAGVVCTQNFDGFIHNYALYRNSFTGLFEMIPWDYDATWGQDINGEEMEFDYIPIEGYNTLTARLLDVPTFRKQYAKIFEEILTYHFNKQNLYEKINVMHNTLRPHVLRDPYVAKFIDDFDREPGIILKFIDDRHHYLRNHLQDLR
ncbi:CotH kinase family protein [Alkalihalobacillus sp. AL-G]|uniref:CotH kinase family protein n=1 Tax=Alkalihalobacillus sp. AL-G TaxID=2926399 RepID=UPI00272B2D15|nr:CotH kinase family protein [Alkalihalobacillus sp. AL-G]WLD94715.1 CotH kinase family protein [Alkalihalobacillus sp. AL-G]